MKDGGKSLLIVILNYLNYEDTINCVNNLMSFNSLKENTTFVIVDNCSPNDSFNKLQMTFINEDNIDVISSDRNGGYSYGNNFGIKYETRKRKFNYIAILNPDVFIENDIFPHLISDLENNDSLGMVTCSVLIDDSFDIYNQSWEMPTISEMYTQQFLLNKKKKAPFHYKRIRKELFLAEIIPGSFFIINGYFFKIIGYFDEHIFMYNDEIILSKKIQNRNMNIGIDFSEYYCHKHKSASSNAAWNNYRYKFNLVMEQYKWTYESRKYVCKRIYGGKGLIGLKIVNKVNILLLYLKHSLSYFMVK